MSKTEATVLSIAIEQAARVAIAAAKGQIAALHRNTIAGLMPRFETTEEADAYTDSFQGVRAQLAA